MILPRKRFSHEVFLIIILSVSLINCVDYSRIVKWEKRSLNCVDNDNKKINPSCKLIIGDESNIMEAECFDEKFTEQSFSSSIKNLTVSADSTRTVCNIRCEGADRDSVISKIPNSAHECIRWYNYNTLKKGDKWFIWRSGKCRNLTITLEVHCGFPISGPNNINILTQNNISLSTRIHL